MRGALSTRAVVLTLVSGLLAIAGPAALGAGNGSRRPVSPEFNLFVETPGAQLFSGRLIARPVQPAGEAAVYSDLAARSARAHAAMQDFQIHSYVPQTDEYVLCVPPGRTENEVAGELFTTGWFQYVHPDWIVFPADCPNDSSFGAQWHHAADRMDSCAGWDIDTGGPSIGVGICDTGVRVTHEDLLLHRREGFNAVDELWESNGGQINDINGHGTATTGCAAANGNNSKGVAGVGWNLSHRMLRVSNSGGGGSSLSILNLASRTSIEAGDKVANVSYTGVANPSVVSTAAYIRSLGGILVWAAGNDGATLTLNGRDEDALIVVGATNSSDVLAGFSARGPFVDLVAPGVDVYTTSNSNKSSYGPATGTSFAAPLTAGLIALIWSENPGLTANEVEQILKAGVDDLGASGVDDLYGYGRINVKRSLDLAINFLSFEFPDGFPDQLDPAGGTTIRVVVVEGTQQPQPGTGELHYNTGAGWVATPMLEVAPNVYDAVFPAADCATEVVFYFSARSAEDVLVYEPRFAPVRAFTRVAATSVTLLAEYDFEAAAGWVASNSSVDAGGWVRSVPSGSQGLLGDPPTDFDGSGQCWVTGNSYGEDLDGGPTRLLSPTLDLSTAAEPYVRYARWFYNDDQDEDRLVVEVTNNGGLSWKLIESVEHTPGWVVKNWRLRDFVTPTALVQLRFSASDNPNNSITEAALDAVAIRDIECAVTPPCPADLDGDGVIGQGDLGVLLADYGCEGGGCAGDIDGDGDTDQGDLGVLLAAYGQACP